ncbi:hypothetical protein [Marinobacterium iners]|uniref:hypothetical protein n=1 Tax=Marinobacterium iners TaxID=48076 RepID=UPI001114D594|nr:hypothetical protein [Marinobacterium iners]
MTAFTKEKFYDESNNPKGEYLPSHCFLCGEPIFGNKSLDTGGSVIWAGVGGPISLHQGCAEILGLHLIQDARSLASMTGVRRNISPGDPTDINCIWYVQK